MNGYLWVAVICQAANLLLSARQIAHGTYSLPWFAIDVALTVFIASAVVTARRST